MSTLEINRIVLQYAVWKGLDLVWYGKYEILGCFPLFDIVCKEKRVLCFSIRMIFCVALIYRVN